MTADSSGKSVKPQIEEKYRNIVLLTKTESYSVEELHALLPGKRLCVCDFPVAGSGAGSLDSDSLAVTFKDVLVIDHHGDRAEYESDRVTSTTIASRFVLAHGPLDPATAVVIHHTDTDSLLAALIMTGELTPLPLYGEASIAADHTGAENLIADTLQALEEERNLDLSVRVLTKLIQKRITVRAELHALVRSGGFRYHNGIAWRIHDSSIDAGLLPWALPDAELIVVASRMTEPGAKKWKIRVRLGRGARGIDLGALDLPDFGGRWNAGSTSRTGGTDIEPEAFVEIIRQKLSSLSR